MSVGSKGNAKSASETEVGQLEVALSVNEQVLGLQIPVKNAMRVAVSDATTELHHELLNDGGAHSHAGQVGGASVGERLSASTLADGKGLHKLLEVQIEKFEHEVQLMTIGVDDIQETDNGRVAHFLEKRDLSDGGGGDTLIFGFETDLLQGDDTAAGGEISGAIDDTISTYQE